MNHSNPIGSPRKKSFRHWLQVLRPLSWWAILVLILYTIRTHQILTSETFLVFEASIEGRRSDSVSATLDGKPIASGSQIGVGRHRITFSHRKAEHVTTNVFVWYGGCDLADVVLKRSKGTLSVEANPAVRLLTVSGPEFRLELTNSVGFTSSVPTDAYWVTANWINHDETNRVNVTAGNEGPVRYSPLLGTLAILSDPAGAHVIGSKGREVGVTPLMLPEVRAGSWKGEVRLDGFVPANVSMRVLPNQTNSFQTNLLSWQYAQAISEARRAASAGDYDTALDAITQALRGNSDDLEANRLKKQFTVARHMQKAKSLSEREDYGSSRTELEALLQIQPEHEEAKALLATVVKQYEKVLAERQKQDEKAAVERIRQARLENLQISMNSLTDQHPDGRFFELHKLTFPKPIKAMGDAIREALATTSPTFEVNKYEWPGQEIFLLEAKQQVPHGLRQVLIAGTEANQSESLILLRVLEYETNLNIDVGGVLKISNGRPPLIALPNHKERVTEGVQMVTARIMAAAQK